MAKGKVIQTTMVTTEVVSFETGVLDPKTMLSMLDRLREGWTLKRADFVYEKTDTAWPASLTPYELSPKGRGRRAK